MIQRAVVATEHPDAFRVVVDGRDQSHVDLADPTRLAFDYVRRMGDVLDAVAPAGTPVRVVHVGGAGLTLPRYVAATRPGSPQVVLEPDEELTALVRAELPLPRRSGIKVRPVDGLAGVAALRDGYAGAVVVDAYADGVVPEELTAAPFLHDLARVLAPGGVVLLNLADRAPFARGREAVAGLRATVGRVLLSAEPATLRGRRAGNLLLVAGAGPALDGLLATLQRSAATSAAPYRVLDERQVSDGFGGGRVRTGPG
ncbi:fused MFS/spermidine synthase [Nocardioides sp. 1609]|uniref:spermidine synthase n=1 Tax=Nocardioides sp. 1609 TaxID=2508327 RepID=UPI00106FE109|nr:fused MFS/spermidine synthase [Nocardioides sp. 1609]